MPWSCCGELRADDLLECPSCKNAKSAWTVQLGHTRVLQVGAAWLELEVVDGKDAPVAGLRFVVRLPDGTEREGALDDAGQARLDRLPKGDCRVWFPGHEAEAVEKLPPRAVRPLTIKLDSKAGQQLLERDAWLELELTHADGSPAADEPYRVEARDGEVREGTLDAQGTARLEGVARGPARVSFPAHAAGEVELVADAVPVG